MTKSQALAEKLTYDYWHLVGHKSEVLVDKDYFKLTIFDKEIVITNDNNNILAFDNICPHRGTRILTNVFGNQAIICPYHGWTYKEGQLRIPNKKAFKDCDIDSANINKLPIQYCGDFIFVGFEPKISLDEQLGGLWSILKKISLDIDKRLDFDHYDFKCDWPIAIENALEPYHINKVHKNTLASLSLCDGINESYGANSLWQTPIGNERIDNSLKKLSNNFKIEVDYQGYQNFLIFPFAMLSTTYGYSYSLQNFNPSIGNDKTNFYSRLLLVKSDNGSIIDYFINSTMIMNKTIFKEDANICALVPGNSWCTEPLKFATDSDKRISIFRKYCRTILNNKEI